MRKPILLMSLMIASSFFLKTLAKADSYIVNETKINEVEINIGEKIFMEHADKCLALIEHAAQKKSIKGVAIIAFIPGDITSSWISKMKVVGSLTNSKANLLAIANSKAAEMADTYIDSGSGIRELKAGELGYKGGLIRKVDSGYILAVFSGGSSEDDIEVSKEGLDWLIKYY